MKKETRQILDDLKTKGMDISSIEAQMRANPLLDHAGDEIIGGGILRQSTFTTYMNSVREDEERVKAQAAQLATLHDASKVATLPKEALDTITALEEALIETGLFTEASIKEISAIGKAPLVNTINNPPPILQNPNPNHERENDMPNPDLSKYVDSETHQTSLANVAFGSIATGLQIQAKIDEVKALGIPVTQEKISALQENMRTGFETGNNNLDTIFEKTFEVSKVREAKANEAIEARIQEEAGKLVAERMKKENLPGRGNFRGNPSPVFGRKKPIYVNSESGTGNGFKDTDGNIDISKLPKNSEGDPKLFLTRGDRTSRVAGASELFETIMQKAESDPFYTD